MRLSGFACLLGLILVLPACTADSAPLRSEARDSAGIRIVENHAPAWSTEQAWQLADAPSTTFGATESLYRVLWGRRLPDGRVILAQNSTLEFLLFAPDGSLLARRGGRGGGPGEFRELSRVRAGPGDSITVFDFPGARVSILDAEGSFARSYQVPSIQGRPSVTEAIFADGSILAIPLGTGPATGQGLVRRERELWHLPLDGGEAVRIAAFPETETFFFEGGGSRRPFFGKHAYYTTSRRGLIWGQTDRLSLHVVSPDGATREIHRIVREPRSFGPSDIQPLVDERLADAAPDRRPMVQRQLSSLPTSGTVPEWGWPDYGDEYGRALLVDDADFVWLAEYFMPSAPTNARTVLDTEGTWLGSVSLPARFSPLHIGSDFILGVFEDELEVEHVQLYELIKP
jgi:hypothetical protein